MKYYNLLLAFHLISIVTWISTIVYLQRLILLQVNTTQQLLITEGFFIYKRLANPAFSSTIVFGIVLIILNKSLLETGLWIYLKFFIISLIIIIHHLCKINLKQLERNQFTTKEQNVNYHSYAPLILVAVVTVLTITKPF